MKFLHRIQKIEYFKIQSTLITFARIFNMKLCFLKEGRVVKTFKKYYSILRATLKISY